ncbi:L,D-transpeptidase family protein [Methylobrevis albus]|uniref:Murein L,D-transpeptidase n=1 Tax=Methylobrevis albus TaxID=2793297 RepID=A0A931MXB3_9HYPH|nr:L,D-transpeptidase [Methylobrevis albus]MBH0236590.1 murein L,D-transpeptidase [Methylobrevis albus]
MALRTLRPPAGSAILTRTAIGLVLLCDLAAAQEFALPRPRSGALPQPAPTAVQASPQAFDDIVTGAIDRHTPPRPRVTVSPPAPAGVGEATASPAIVVPTESIPGLDATPGATEAVLPGAIPPASAALEPAQPAALAPPAATAPQPSTATYSPAESLPATDAPPPVEAAPAPGPLQAPAPVAAQSIDPRSFAASANQTGLMPGLRGDQRDPAIARLQVLLDRAGVSPGVIDGLIGSNVAKAVAAFQTIRGLPVDGLVTQQLLTALEDLGGPPAFVDYVITEADAAGPFYGEIPKDYAELAQLPTLGWRNPAEALAEAFHMDEGFLRWLNPGADFFVAGTVITVTDPGRRVRTPVAHIVADKARKQVFGYGYDGALVVAYPATIGSTSLPSPTGIHAVRAVATDPEYWYRPDVNFVQGNNTKALRLAPGPNNPVGTVWIGLDKPTYGIHGTPEPSRIDKTSSHGCLRLTNWDARELVHLVKPGVTVEFLDPNMTVATEEAPPTALSEGAVLPQ